MTFTDKRILLGVTGGIAVYKSPDLVRRLRTAGADVQVVMTAGAQQFVTPLTFQAVSGHPVRTELWDTAAEMAMGHIELARWADLILVAPASADFMAKLAHGLADDLLSALALAELAERAGIPAGVFNVVTTANPVPVGAELTQNPIVRKFSFTGSTEIGKLLARHCTSTVKKVSLELGGNAPFIVFDDADLDAAVDGAMMSKYRNMGQTCVCANRILVQDSVYDAFAQKLGERVAQMKVGDGAEDGVTQGPLINEDAVRKVEHLLKDATSKGATVVTGGHRHKLGGTFFEPTIVTGVTTKMDFAREEIFGPVATLFRFKTEDEAIAMANDTQYGLAAYFYARDVGRIFRVSEALEYGIVGINEGIISTEVAPFGGVKESGIGREGGKEGLEEFLETKYVAVNL